MHSNRFSFHLGILITTLSLAGSPVLAQDGAAPVSGSFWLRVTAEQVNVRSRADMNARVVTRAPLNSVLHAVGEEGAWYRILPPEGVFSLVSGEYIDRSGAQPVVKVTVGTLRVRVGSAVVDTDPEKEEVQTRLSNGTPVRIVGEQPNGWLRIAPPDGVYYYISKTYTERISDQQRLEIERSPDSKLPAPPARRGEGRNWEPVPASPPQSPPPATTTKEPIVAGSESLAPVEATPTPKTQPEPGVTVDESGRVWTPVPSSPPGQGSAEPSEATPAPAESNSTLASDQVTASPVNVSPATHEPSEPAAQQSTTAEQESQTHENGAMEEMAPASANPESEAAQPMPTEARPTPIPRVAAPAASPPAAPDAEVQPGQLPKFLAQGILRPNFTLPVSPLGLRYELVRPGTNQIVAYAEFGAHVQVNPTKIVGSYVGIAGEIFVDQASKKELIRVNHITVLDMPAEEARRSRESRR